jgi:clumping factor A
LAGEINLDGKILVDSDSDATNKNSDTNNYLINDIDSDTDGGTNNDTDSDTDSATDSDIDCDIDCDIGSDLDDNEYGDINYNNIIDDDYNAGPEKIRTFF